MKFFQMANTYDFDKQSKVQSIRKSFHFANSLVTLLAFDNDSLVLLSFNCTYTAARASFLHSIGTIGRPKFISKHNGNIVRL